MESNLQKDTESASAARSTSSRSSIASLSALLLGNDEHRCDVPELSEIIAALTALATGARTKVLLPLGGSPSEFAFVRQGESVLVSLYETGASPEVHVLDRAIDLMALLNACARAAMSGAIDADPTTQQITSRLADRALGTRLAPLDESHALVKRRGGYEELPRRDIPVAFGFEANIPAGTASSPASGTSTSDVHALLFDGSLWAFIRGRRVPLVKGPVMLAIQRMTAAVRAVVDAWNLGRAANVRLHSGSFQIGIRLSRSGETTLSLGNGSASVTAAALDVPNTTLPILRLAGDVLRTLVNVDRAQAKNLRVRALRDEIRSLRRLVRNRDRRDSFVNLDPDRLRTSSVPPLEATQQASGWAPAPTSLRFTERWRLEIDGIDATSTYFCGDRLVVATARHTLSIDRASGDVLWARDGAGTTTMMAGTALLRISIDGQVEICEVETGETQAVAQILPRVGTPTTGIPAGGGSLPPVAILTEGGGQLVAIDLRHGELRWRFNPQREGLPRLVRAGRVLVVVCGDGSVHALDVATGELVWRFAERERFVVRPAVCRDVVLAASGECGSRKGSLYAIDLFSGQLRWTRPLPSGPTAAPIDCGSVGVVPTGTLRHGALQAFDPNSGELQWEIADPGVSAGGATLAVDRNLIVNAPAGRITSIDSVGGRVTWSQQLTDPLADVPRKLDPVLRGGALFVPASRVHVLRVSDGTVIGEPLPCDLIPDALRVDERSWVYIAEESGFLAACAPVPHLTLVR